tara:strand:- start:1835 stop:2524 length:690 start_codon:yes stop_codon:yes gene_type:complete
MSESGKCINTVPGQPLKLPLFEFAKSQNLYHFDPDKPDDDDLILKPKFKGDWTKDVENFRSEHFNYSMEKEHMRMQHEEWNNLRYDVSRFLTKMHVNPETQPMLEKMRKHIPLDPERNIQVQMTCQQPGQYIPYHMDVLTSTGLQPKEVVERGRRIIVFLTDWLPGEFMVWGNTSISHWKAGWILTYPALKYPHATANSSHHAGYRLRCSGATTQETLDWINSDEIIDL